MLYVMLDIPLLAGAYGFGAEDVGVHGRSKGQNTMDTRGGYGTIWITESDDHQS